MDHIACTKRYKTVECPFFRLSVPLIDSGSWLVCCLGRVQALSRYWSIAAATARLADLVNFGPTVRRSSMLVISAGMVWNQGDKVVPGGVEEQSQKLVHFCKLYYSDVCWKKTKQRVVALSTQHYRLTQWWQAQGGHPIPNPTNILDPPLTKFRWLVMPVLRKYAAAAYFAHYGISRNILAKCACRIYFSHKLALSTAISIFCVFLFEAVFVVIRKWQTICKVNLKKILQTALNLLNLKVIVFTLGIISVKLGQKNSCTIQILLLAYLRSLHVICSIACPLFNLVRNSVVHSPSSVI